MKYMSLYVTFFLLINICTHSSEYPIELKNYNSNSDYSKLFSELLKKVFTECGLLKKTEEFGTVSINDVTDIGYTLKKDCLSEGSFTIRTKNKNSIPLKLFGDFCKNFLDIIGINPDLEVKRTWTTKDELKNVFCKFYNFTNNKTEEEIDDIKTFTEDLVNEFWGKIETNTN